MSVPDSPQIISELRNAIERQTADKSGWLEVKPYWFKDQDQMLDFMVSKGKRVVHLLESRIAELEGGVA